VNSTCVGFEECTEEGICVCPPPYFGALCNTLGVPVVTSVIPSNGTELGGTMLQVIGANISDSDVCVFVGTSGTLLSNSVVIFIDKIIRLAV
jgi:hypothetical protein